MSAGAICISCNSNSLTIGQNKKMSSMCLRPKYSGFARKALQGSDGIEQASASTLGVGNIVCARVHIVWLRSGGLVVPEQLFQVLKLSCQKGGDQGYFTSQAATRDKSWTKGATKKISP